MQGGGQGGAGLHGLGQVGARVQAAVEAGAVQGVRHGRHRGAVGLDAAQLGAGRRHPVAVDHLGQVALSRGHGAGLRHAQRQLLAFLVNLANGGLVGFDLGG